MALPSFLLHRLPPLLPKATCSCSSSSLTLPANRKVSSLLPSLSFCAFSLPLSSSTDGNYLSLSDKALFAQCEMDTFRGSGPGGQHRNKTESAVRLKHIPTGLVAQATNDRSQHKNRADALERLRRLIATKVRRHVDLAFYKAPPELIRILPVVKGQNKVVQPVGPKHPEFLPGLQAFLDLLYASEGYIQVAAWVLRMSTADLSKVITSDKFVLEAINEVRASKGLKALR